LVRARIAVQRAALDSLVDRALHAHVLGIRSLLVASLHRIRQPAQVGLDGRRVPAVLEPLALRAQDALLLGVDVGHGDSREAPARTAMARRGAPYYSGV